jgi:hypothetical protein
LFSISRDTVKVERTLELHKRLASVRASADREMYQRQTARPVLLGAETTDRQIDALVYELYGLTNEEIHIVENR